jgi:hypothetical protein
MLCSASYSDADENGIIRMVLCRVIMGNVEVVRQGSKQNHPSNSNFDSGVDDVANPKHYVIWDMHVNKRVFPEFAVAIRMPSQAKGSRISFFYLRNSLFIFESIFLIHGKFFFTKWIV